MSIESKSANNREDQWVVVINDEEVRCSRPSGLTESVTWDDLRVVAIETTDEGPYSMDMFWLLTGEKTGCIIPQGARGEEVLLERLQRLPGFNNEVFIEAMGSTENRRFICWQKNAT